MEGRIPGKSSDDGCPFKNVSHPSEEIFLVGSPAVLIALREYLDDGEDYG
jgi:hypothetical protein